MGPGSSMDVAAYAVVLRAAGTGEMALEGIAALGAPVLIRDE